MLKILWKPWRLFSIFKIISFLPQPTMIVHFSSHQNGRSSRADLTFLSKSHHHWNRFRYLQTSWDNDHSALPEIVFYLFLLEQNRQQTLQTEKEKILMAPKVEDTSQDEVIRLNWKIAASKNWTQNKSDKNANFKKKFWNRRKKLRVFVIRWLKHSAICDYCNYWFKTERKTWCLFAIL